MVITFMTIRFMITIWKVEDFPWWSVCQIQTMEMVTRNEKNTGTPKKEKGR